MKCKSCGKIIKETDVFCSECIDKVFGSLERNYSPPVSGGFTAGIKSKVVSDPDHITMPEPIQSSN